MAEVIDIPGVRLLTEPADYEKLGYDRRHSTGKIMIPPHIRAKVLSRYLKEPAGSCHDNCKLGLKHEPEQKKRYPIPVRVTRASKAETSPKPSSARNSQKSGSHDLKMDVTASTGFDKSGIVREGSSELQTLNHGNLATTEGHDVEMVESGVADKEIMTESHNSNLLETNDSNVQVLQIHGESKNLEASNSSSDEMRISSENNQNSSSDTFGQEVNSTQIMVVPSEVSTSNHEELTVIVADEQLESEIEFQPSESKLPEGDVTAAVIEKADEQCEGQILKDAETKSDGKKMRKKKQGVNYNKPVRHSKSQQSATQTPTRKNVTTVIKPDIDSQLLVPSRPNKPHVPRRNTRGSKMRTPTPVYIPKNADVNDGEETSCPMNSEKLSGSTSKDDTGFKKQMRIPMIRNKGNQVVPSVSSRKLDNRVLGVKARCGNLKKVACSEENSNNVKVETKNLKGVNRLKNQGAVKDDTNEGSGDYPPEKTLHMIETEPENKLIPSDSNTAHGNIMSMSSSSSEAKSFEKKNNRVPTGRSPPQSVKNMTRKTAHASQSAASSSSSKNMSHTRIRDGIYDHRLSSSTFFSVESSMSSIRRASSELKKAHTDRKMRRMKMTSMDNHKTGRQNILNDKQTGKTLRFRKGKVIDLQPVDCAPKRLKFRKRVIHDRGTPDGQHGGGLENKIVEKKIYVPKGTTSGSNSQKVHLRHQNLDTKNKSAGLFNNVIEETASKLVKSRSKVKALVTAFEVVISQQDINPSAMTHIYHSEFLIDMLV